jgi:hypothetical protein
MITLSRIFRRKRPGFSRAAQRYNCRIEGNLAVGDRLVNFDGIVTDFSSGGAQFRPKLLYIMDRRDVPISLIFGGVEVTGRIMSTSSAGFGLRFDAPMSDDQIESLIGLANKQKDSIH